MSRLLPFVLLAAACAADISTSEAPLADELVAVVPVVTLTSTPLRPGQSVTFTVSGATPGKKVYLGVSTKGAGLGPCPALLGGLCLGIKQPELLASKTVNGAGVATFVAVVPPSTLGATVSFQAGMASGGSSAVTNVLTVTVTDDVDGDGVAFDAGDCDDDDAKAMPGGAEFAGNGVDDDCDGTVDEDLSCESGLVLDSTNAADAAAAMGICDPFSGPGTFGVLSVQYVLPDDAPAPALPAFDVGHGIMADFGGIAAPEGDAMVALSSGVARSTVQPGFADPLTGFAKPYVHGPPPGFVATLPACPGVTLSPAGNDGVALQVVLQVPPNAGGFSFDSSAFFSEFPFFTCSSFNDPVAVMMLPPPPGFSGPTNVLQDAGGPITVNSVGLVRHCPAPGTVGGVFYSCPLGPVPAATGFGLGASTGWMRSVVEVEPGSMIALTFSVWDSGDKTFDATALFDGFAWLPSATGISTTPL